MNFYPKPVEFFEGFQAGTVPASPADDSTAQCALFQRWQASILPAAFYTTITVYGQNDLVGRSCLGPFANDICQALASATTGATAATLASTTCGGYDWAVQAGCDGGFELTVQPAGNGAAPCTCQPSATVYALRPCGSTTAINWGGVNSAGSNCGSADDAIGLLCGFLPGCVRCLSWRAFLILICDG